MILIEQDAKRLLMERLDECLKVHADMLDAQNIGSIYELQGLSELHYYLKVEHVFTPAEVEALLLDPGPRPDQRGGAHYGVRHAAGLSAGALRKTRPAP